MQLLTILGVPTSAGTHHAGMERTPQKMRQVGLLQKLNDVGSVVDSGDLPVTPYRSLGIGLACRDLDRVTRIDQEVSARIEEIVSTDGIPLVLGGDCTITLGVTSGLLSRFPDIGVIYFDGDVDLTTPYDSSSGILDAMVSAHLLGRVDNILSRIGPRFPLLTTHDIVYFGYHPMELPPTHDQWLNQHAVLRFPVTDFDDPVNAAHRAVTAIGAADRPVLIHFDVDVIDSGDAPLCNFPHFNGGLSLAEAFDCLTVFLEAPQIVGLVITEINPDHDREGYLLQNFVERLAQSLRYIIAHT